MMFHHHHHQQQQQQQQQQQASVQNLQEAINNLLNVREQGEFIEIINDYHCRRNVQDFSHALSVLLDTPAKRQLIGLVRKILPKSDIGTFDELMSFGVPSPPHTLPRSNSLGHLHQAALHNGSAASTHSMPARFVQTIPSRGAKIVRKTMRTTDFLGSDKGHMELPAWEAAPGTVVKRVYMEQPTNPLLGLGFSIRGGAEHGIGIYVSYVDVESIAERQGLAPADQIISVNGMSFRKITHEEAAKIIKSSKKLDMEVRNVGRVPGSFETHQTYTWVDSLGHTVSPPPEVDRMGRYEAAGERKSGLMLLKATDERKVHLVVTSTKTLGLMIRGGSEFGLGIYITGVDRGSVAESAGLKVGDQILDVNGTSFLDVCHNDAVKVLKSSKHLILTIKDVGKLPYARTTYDQTQWVRGAAPQFHTRPPSRNSNGASNGTSAREKFTNSYSSDVSTHMSTLPKSLFTRGVGSQLMHSSMSGPTSQLSLLEDQARQVLDDHEHTTLNYYLAEYQKGFCNVDNLLSALFQLLDNEEKLSLMGDVRSIISAKDIEHFDSLVMGRRQARPNRLKSRSMEALYVGHGGMSDNSFDSTSSDSKRSHLSLNLPPPKPPRAKKGNNKALRQAIELLHTDRLQEAQRHGAKYSVAVRTASGSDTSNTSVQVVAEVHQPPQHRKHPLYEEMRSPSEDSGVELNGIGTATEPSVQSHLHSLHNGGRGEPARQTARATNAAASTRRHTSQSNRNTESPHHEMYTQNWKTLSSATSRVTVSKQEPVIINEILDEDSFETSGQGVAARLPTHDPHRCHSPTVATQTDMLSSSSLDIPGMGMSRHPDMLRTLPAQAELESRSPSIFSNSANVYSVIPDREPQVTDRHHRQSLHHRPRSKERLANGVHIDSTSNMDADGLVLSVPNRTSNHHQIQLADDDEDLQPYHIRLRMLGMDARTDDSRESVGHSGGGGVNSNSGAKPKQTGQAKAPPPPLPPRVSSNYKSTHVAMTTNQRFSTRSEDFEENWQFRQISDSIPPPPPLPPPPIAVVESASPPPPLDIPDIPIMESRRHPYQPVHYSSPDAPNGLLTTVDDYNARHVNGNASLRQSQRGHQNTSSYSSADNDYGDNLPDGEIKHITVYKVHQTLGVAIEGGANTRQPLPRIINIQPGGCAHEARSLRVGHIVLTVNRRKLQGLSHKQCARAVAEAFKDQTKDRLELVVLDTAQQMTL